jgi:multiple sugar transport system permease protein
MAVLVKVITYAFLIAMAVVVVFPFYWMIISSLKTENEYNLAIPTLWPQALRVANYIDAFNTANLGTLFGNTLFVGLVSTLLSLVITVLSAFAFARLEFKGKETLFGLLLATMMIPGELFTITNYVTMTWLNWLDTFQALIIPFLVSVFYIYLLRQNFMQIPNELYLAAKVDGCGDLKYLWKVMIPMALPTLISITILKMMGAWNSYVWPNLVTSKDEMRLISDGLRNAFADISGRINYPVQMAAVTIVSFPLFMVFLFLRKYIMSGVSRSGIKG